MSELLKAMPDREWIIADPAQSFRWQTHDFPCDIARWNYHPEYEIHLIRKSFGRAFVGDHIGEFGPGYLAIVGSNLPHNWVSDLGPGEVVRDRDVVLQFDAALILQGSRIFPEFSDLESFLEAAKRGLQFHGDTAQQGAALMERIGQVKGYQRLTLFLDLLRCLALSSERSFLARTDYEPSLDHTSSPIVNEVMSYILANLAADVRMSEAARIAGMSEPSFSRFFKKNTGNNFVDCVRKLRIGRACRLLSRSRTPVTEICFEVGYNNISNFNRHFLSECGVTPSRYRNLSGNRVAPQGSIQHTF